MPPVRRLLGYVARYRRSFLLGLACVIATTAITLAGPWVLKYAIDDLSANVTAAKVRFYAVALLALSAIGGVFRFLMRRIIIGASRDIEYDLRNDFFAALQRLELSFFHQRRTGDLMSRATNDLGVGAADDRPGGHVHVDHRAHVRRRHRDDAVDRRRG